MQNPNKLLPQYEPSQGERATTVRGYTKKTMGGHVFRSVMSDGREFWSEGVQSPSGTKFSIDDCAPVEGITDWDLIMYRDSSNLWIVVKSDTEIPALTQVEAKMDISNIPNKDNSVQLKPVRHSTKMMPQHEGGGYIMRTVFEDGTELWSHDTRKYGEDTGFTRDEFTKDGFSSILPRYDIGEKDWDFDNVLDPVTGEWVQHVNKRQSVFIDDEMNREFAAWAEEQGYVKPR